MIVKRDCCVLATIESPTEFYCSDGTWSPYFDDAAILTQNAAANMLTGTIKVRAVPVEIRLEI